MTGEAVAGSSKVPAQGVTAATPAPGRACGTCTMCCKVHFIGDFDKPPGVWCKHAQPGRGCKIYDDRPQICRDFYCQWMLDASYGPEWKPDTAKFVVSLSPGDLNLLIAVDPNFPNAWRRETYLPTILGWVQMGEALGRFVLVRIGQRCIALLPDGDHELGPVGPDDGVFVAREPGPAGYVYRVSVQRDAQAGAAPANGTS